MSEALPDGTRLLHIGPHKTGTTSVQRAFWDTRELLPEHGVHWAGGLAHPMSAAMAAAGNQLATGQQGSGDERWAELAAEVRGSTARMTVVSSEFFSDAPAARVTEIVDALGAEQTRVVITLRPVTRILASQWQQYMQNQPMVKYVGNPDYEGWLDQVLNRPDQQDVTPSFWRRHRHDRLVETWASALGPDRLVVVVVDDARPRDILTSFEELTGLPVGLLQPREASANRSLTLPEVTMLRAFNAGWTERDWSQADYTRYVRFGAVRHLMTRKPDPDEPPIRTPAWAVERANEIGAEMIGAIARTGVRVDGDLSLLASAEPRSVGDNPAVVEVPDEVVARFAAGLAKVIAETPGRPAPSARRAGPLETGVRAHRARRTPSSADPRPVEDLGRVALLRAAAGRVRRRLRRQSVG
ncbi:hypothetical protein GCM10009795_049490 [Nocardioides hankookensis]|uniref:Sulfotransferase family protein n=1 Tax=Nocardioides hankookensis TaxID=443157 RepID=A0ABW1LFD0_9ACTN